MSPEMARGDVSGAPGDLYAVALLMAEMIAGRPVVEATAQIDILMAHASTEALRLPDACSASPFYAIIQRALAKDLKVRYRTALQMRADVQATSDLHQRAVKMAERLEGMSPDMAPTLALDDDMADALSAAVRQAANAPPPELGQTIQLDDAALATMRMESMSADLPATASSAPAPMVFVAPPPRPADTSSRGGFVWVIVLFVALMVIFAVGGYLLAG
jgi:serine/threonine protein kinase